MFLLLSEYEVKMDKNEEYGDDKVPDSREERIKKYLKEKARITRPYEIYKLNRNPFTRRLKKRSLPRLINNSEKDNHKPIK